MTIRPPPRSVPLLFGPYGGLSEELSPVAADNGVNAVWFHMFQEEQFERCGRHGFAACVELKTFRVDFARRPELVPIGVDGRPIRYGRLVQGVCLSHPELVVEIEEALESGLRTFRPAGIWLDYLSYAGWFETPDPDLQESCFCAACIREFCDSTGIDAATPQAVLDRHREAWTAHKCERITGFARRFAALIRDRLPGCLLGAYMCPWRPEEYGGALRKIFAQDYVSLAPFIDVFSPLIYSSKSGRAPEWSRQFLEASPGFVPHENKVQLILDELDYPASLLSAVAASPPSWGMQIFGGARVFQDPDSARVFARCVASVGAACG